MGHIFSGRRYVCRCDAFANPFSTGFWLQNAPKSVKNESPAERCRTLWALWVTQRAPVSLSVRRVCQPVFYRNAVGAVGDPAGAGISVGLTRLPTRSLPGFASKMLQKLLKLSPTRWVHADGRASVCWGGGGLIPKRQGGPGSGREAREGRETTQGPKGPTKQGPCLAQPRQVRRLKSDEVAFFRILPPAHSHFTTCSPAHSHFSPPAHHLLTTCSQPFYHLLTTCSPAHSHFTTCSPPAHGQIAHLLEWGG
eukprot:gene19265-biopygen23475